jgi:hypothetical protein
MVEEKGPELIAKSLELALAGDTGLLRVFLGVLLPAIRKDRHITLDLPPIRSAQDALDASRAVVEAIAGGAITPSEGDALARAIEFHARLYTTVEIEQSVTELEAARGLAS